MIRRFIFKGQSILRSNKQVMPFKMLNGFKGTFLFSVQENSSVNLQFPHLRDLSDLMVKRIQEEKVKNLKLLNYLKQLGEQVGDQDFQNDLNAFLIYGKQLIMMCMANDTSRGDFYMIEFYKIIISSIEKALLKVKSEEKKGILQGKFFIVLSTLDSIYFNYGYLDNCFECTKKLLELYNGKRNENNKFMTFIPDNVFYMIGDAEKANKLILQVEIEFFYCDKASVLFQQLQKFQEAQQFSDKALEITFQIKDKPGYFYFNAFNKNISLILLSGNNEQVIARYQNMVDKFDYNNIKDSKVLLDKYSLRIIQAMQISMNFFKDKFNAFWEHYQKFKVDTQFKQSREEVLRLHCTYIQNNNPAFFSQKETQERVDSFIAKYDDMFQQIFKDIFFAPLKQKQQPLYDYCMYLQHTEAQYKQGLIQTLHHLNMLKQNKNQITQEFDVLQEYKSLYPIRLFYRFILQRNSFAS
ncbi:hypothetical protein TTHMIC_00033 [Tetrahymena thermophila SB210]|uniref:Uncharacterized protein n=1 Tax=Tetrahymena thermophila (strain SB210) TaxID=312017 RepID=A0A1B9C283_TETTS|nr:hypothetical protein TTHMIC_00033 [Tetrahymena thermophila SB210]